MTPHYSITTARPQDLARLPAIELAAARLLAGHAPESVLNETTAPDVLHEAQRAGRLWVALLDEVAVGFAHVGLIERGAAHLEEIDVAPPHGRRGLGTHLISQACRWAADVGYSSVTLSTFRDVPWNMPFYARLGFKVVPRGQLSPAMRAIVTHETRRGLDPARRVVMRRESARGAVPARRAQAGRWPGIFRMPRNILPFKAGTTPEALFVAVERGSRHGRSSMSSRLHNGDVFPHLTIDVVGGTTLAIPRDLAGSYAVVLFYRGAWCPYCCAQLSAFARAGDRLAASGVAIVALSVDDEPTSNALVDKLHLTFPVGFGANADTIAELTGAYVAEGSAYVQSTGFVLDPRGRILTAVYSSGAIGRLVPDDVVGFVRYVEAHRDPRQEAALQT